MGLFALFLAFQATHYTLAIPHTHLMPSSPIPMSERQREIVASLDIVHPIPMSERQREIVASLDIVHHIIFVDQHQISKIDSRLEHRIHTPQPGGKVIAQDKPWESWAVFAYNHVMPFDDGFRMYYDCIEGTGLPPGRNSANGGQHRLGSLSHRRICLAVSTDGIKWTKPELGIFSWKNSATGVTTTANNILLEDSGVSVFHDTQPGIPDTERYKMVCSAGAYASPDGLRWSKLPFAPTATDDTKPTAYYDPNLGKYVISVRRDFGGRWNREIGRCVTSNISDWEQESRDPNGTEVGCPSVFRCDTEDPPGLDIYTNSWTPYPRYHHAWVHL